MEFQEIIKIFEEFTDPQAAAGMARYGIKSAQVYGVSIPKLRKMAKEIGTDRGLAAKLWKVNCRERRILAGMIDD